MTININNSAVVRFTNQLEKMKRSALPNAVRGTLNKAALDVKRKSMPESARTHFKDRSRGQSGNFFKANSKVQMATGWNITTMKATVGFVSHNLRYNNEAIHDLEDQEFGGEIDKRALIPLNSARKGGNSTPVRPGNRLRLIQSKVMGGKLSNIPEASKNQKGLTDRQKYIMTAIFVGSGGYMIAGMHGRKFLYRVNSVHKEGNRTFVNSTALYTFKRGRSARIKTDTHFMREASLKSANQLNKFFIEEAERQFARIK